MKGDEMIEENVMWVSKIFMRWGEKRLGRRLTPTEGAKPRGDNTGTFLTVIMIHADKAPLSILIFPAQTRNYHISRLFFRGASFAEGVTVGGVVVGGARCFRGRPRVLRSGGVGSSVIGLSRIGGGGLVNYWQNGAW